MAQKTPQTLKCLQGAIRAAQMPTLVTGMLCHCNLWSVAEDKASIFCAQSFSHVIRAASSHVHKRVSVFTSESCTVPWQVDVISHWSLMKYSTLAGCILAACSPAVPWCSVQCAATGTSLAQSTLIRRLKQNAAPAMVDVSCQVCTCPGCIQTIMAC